MEISVGMKGEAVTLAEREDTAKEIGSGDLLVYATPCMAALMEGAACEAIADALSDTQTTVGTLLNIEHTSATPVGLEVRAEAEVTAVDARLSPSPSAPLTRPERSAAAPTSASSSIVRNSWTRHTTSCKEENLWKIMVP